MRIVFGAWVFLLLLSADGAPVTRTLLVHPDEFTDVSSFARGFHSSAGGYDRNERLVSWCSLTPPGPGDADFHRPCMLFHQQGF